MDQNPQDATTTYASQQSNQVDGYRTYITDSALAVVLIDQTETGKLLQQQKTVRPAEQVYNISSTADDMHIHCILLVSQELQETDITQLQILV